MINVPEWLKKMRKHVLNNDGWDELYGDKLDALIERLTHCERTVHAEANAIVQAARNGVCIDGSTIYTTASPCWPCFQLIANGGIVRIVFAEFYRDKRIAEQAVKLNIELVDATNTGATHGSE